jgi:hypothetical protein
MLLQTVKTQYYRDRLADSPVICIALLGNAVLRKHKREKYVSRGMGRMPTEGKSPGIVLGARIETRVLMDLLPDLFHTTIHCSWRDKQKRVAVSIDTRLGEVCSTGLFACELITKRKY